MTLLSRYLLRQNVFLLLTILMVGIGLYLLTDMFERLDTFLESGVGATGILFYFMMKIPSIVSQILPAVYLMALVVQMNFLERSRELVALASGGISPMAIARFVFVYGIVWALLQLFFSQVAGVAGERISGRIWQEDVRGNVLEEAGIRGLWFTDGRYIVHIGIAYPVKKTGENIVVYALDDHSSSIDEIIKAKRFVISSESVWTLEQGRRLVPAEYASHPFEQMELPLTQDLRAFQVGASAGIKISQLSLIELGDMITRLERAGSNAESLRTAWHGKLAYAASIVVMGILALIVSRLTPNIYKATVLAILIVFFYYVTNTMCFTMGEKGILTPSVGAWFANALFFFCGLFWLVWPSLLRRIQG